jgi:hypothetical protein
MKTNSGSYLSLIRRFPLQAVQAVIDRDGSVTG